ncbi:geranylgeranyl pyrophosphate synthase isoform X6 [Lagenorhynchus albirostris]|uniref:geranylgeranyl pyrophosphate synthase isoform X6 n=1 Tax=Lagenorhynchus albirostris TaxID=27610 RepID=UPI0028E4B833|nr:geranylgeranyl pyrophosphate synthase isoform X6 [Lagenorhynchus albirostris]
MEKTQETAQRILLEPYKYLLQLPGKQVRTKLSQAFNHWLKVPEDKLQIIIEVTEMLHNASLLIDDIEDNSKLRRGFPVAHSIYGIPSVINSAKPSAPGAILWHKRDFPGGAVENPPANAGDMGSFPDSGRSHMLRRS